LDPFLTGSSCVLDKQFTDTSLLRQLIRWGMVLLLSLAGIGLFGMGQVQAMDPYAREVLALNGDPQVGHAIFQVNCAGCHGMEAAGKVGPSLLKVANRRSKVSLIYQVTSGQTPPMPKFQPQPQEMADLLGYLEGL
jgi:mono/diheme cytochrome c family protein